MGTANGVHRLALIAMVAALFIGFFCALGHHLFYASLAGNTAPTGQYNIAGAQISTQQLNTAVGTAFGFLVKSLLSITIGTAFAQAFWRALRTSAKGPTLASLDSTFSVLSNVFGLFQIRAWSIFPLPLILAVIAWIIPIASIITPATLSVQANPVTPAPKHMMSVPKLDFTSQDFVAPMPGGTRGFCFNGPSQAVERIAAAVAAQGEILPIPAPGANVSWTLDFWAPSLTCTGAADSQRIAMWDHILDQWGNVSDCSYAYGYMAWAATSNDSLPFIPHGSNSTSRVLQQAQLTYGAPASIYVATMPQMFNFAFMPSDSLTEEKCRFFGSDSLIYTYPIANDVCLPGLRSPGCYGQQAWLTNSTLLKCDLMNATYHAQFDYRDGKQSVAVTTGNTSSPVAPQECVESESDADESWARLTSYQGISAAFNQLVLGSIRMGGYGTPTQGVDSKLPGVVFDSSIATTILMETQELAFVVNFDGVNQTFDYLQTMDVNKFPSRRNFATGRRGDLKSALELLFQNITLSLLADEMLQPNFSSPFAPDEQSEVTFNTFHNVYVYSAVTLWVAYGSALLLTSVALGFGVWAMMLNGGTFTNDFSTVLRTSHGATLSEDLRDEDKNGRQPLPKRLASARIKFGVGLADEEFVGSNETLREIKEPPTAETSLLSLRRETE